MVGLTSCLQWRVLLCFLALSAAVSGRAVPDPGTVKGNIELHKIGQYAKTVDVLEFGFSHTRLMQEERSGVHGNTFKIGSGDWAWNRGENGSNVLIGF
eukprot:6546338-Prorocentrum_lima.AAC.1